MKISFEGMEETPEIYVNGKLYVPEVVETKAKATLYDALVGIHGASEWDDNLGMIQKWFYGSYIKDSWCATAVSWAADVIGILGQIGGKNDNVYLMMLGCQIAGTGEFYARYLNDIPEKIEKGDILFYLWDGNKMNENSSKHVSICAATTTGDQILSEGGNQKNKICALYYDKSKLYAVYRPKY